MYIVVLYLCNDALLMTRMRYTALPCNKLGIKTQRESFTHTYCTAKTFALFILLETFNTFYYSFSYLALYFIFVKEADSDVIFKSFTVVTV